MSGFDTESYILDQVSRSTDDAQRTAPLSPILPGSPPARSTLPSTRRNRHIARPLSTAGPGRRRMCRLVLWTVAAVSAVACSSMTIRADHDSQVDFPSYAAFAVFERPGNERRGPQMSEIVDRRIATAMKADLVSKGFTAARPPEADFLVTFSTAVHDRVVVNRSGWYGYRWHYWGGGMTRVNSYPEGTLVIDIIDRKSRNLVWRGVGEGAFSTMNPSDKKVHSAVTRILRTFPPGR